jgi:hypothetical protein
MAKEKAVAPIDASKAEMAANAPAPAEHREPHTKRGNSADFVPAMQQDKKKPSAPKVSETRNGMRRIDY